MVHERVHLEMTDVEQRNQHIARYDFACTYAKSKEILDIACGEGFGSYMLAGAGSRKTIGVDIFEETIENAKKKYLLNNLEFLVGDAQAVLFPFPWNRFDLIVSFETIEHIKFPGKHLSAITEMLKSDGIYICSTPVRAGGSLSEKPANPFHFREWNLIEFRNLLSEYFKEIKIFGQSFYFPENPIPYNRSMMNILCRLFFKNQWPKFFRETVTEFPDLPGFFYCLPQFQVAVCKTPIPMGDIRFHDKEEKPR